MKSGKNPRSAGLRGAWCLGRFAHHAPKLGRPGVAGGATCDCVRMLGDKAMDGGDLWGLG